MFLVQWLNNILLIFLIFYLFLFRVRISLSVCLFPLKVKILLERMQMTEVVRVPSGVPFLIARTQALKSRTTLCRSVRDQAFATQYAERAGKERVKSLIQRINPICGEYLTLISLLTGPHF